MQAPTQDPAAAQASRSAIGCMCGTSLDGLDGVLISAEGQGLGLGSVRMIGARSVELPATDLFSSLSRGEPCTPEQIARAATALGQAHAVLARELCRGADVELPDLVCVHGQTVFHQPPISWQLVNPWPIAHELACPVVFDLRSSDLAGHGQGAPITPLADWVLFRSPGVNRVIVNLGGFCNATFLPAGGGPEAVRALDICACNQVLDRAARSVLRTRFDADGRAASRGSADPRAVAELRLVLDGQARSQRSLGTGDEAGDWVERWAAVLPGDDLLASACVGVGGAVADRLKELGPGEVFLAGGSVRNRTLVEAIRRGWGGPVETTESLGVAPAWREAVCFAVLGLLLADGVEITLPGVTGRAGSIPLSGAWIIPPRNQAGETRHRPTGRMC